MKKVCGASFERNASFDAFVARNYPRLVQSLSLIVLDRELAADAAQDALLKAHLHWDKVARCDDPDAWLYRVAINRCRDMRRHLARAVRALERLTNAYVERETRPWEPPGELISVLRPLPLGQRTAAALYYVGDFSTAEIASVMGVAEGTVNSHLHRAREALRKALEADNETP